MLAYLLLFSTIVAINGYRIQITDVCLCVRNGALLRTQDYVDGDVCVLVYGLVLDDIFTTHLEDGTEWRFKLDDPRVFRTETCKRQAGRISRRFLIPKVLDVSTKNGFHVDTPVVDVDVSAGKDGLSVGGKVGVDGVGAVGGHVDLDKNLHVNGGGGKVNVLGGEVGGSVHTDSKGQTSYTVKGGYQTEVGGVDVHFSHGPDGNKVGAGVNGDLGSAAKGSASVDLDISHHLKPSVDGSISSKATGLGVQGHLDTSGGSLTPQMSQSTSNNHNGHNTQTLNGPSAQFKFQDLIKNAKPGTQGTGFNPSTFFSQAGYNNFVAQYGGR